MAIALFLRGAVQFALDFGGEAVLAVIVLLDDVLKKLNTMETTAASWLEQVQNVIGDSADVRGLSLSGSCL